MRILLSIFAIGMLLATVGARAQRYDPRYPVCMHVFTGGGGFGGSDWYECTFTSLPQCAASASGLAATCVVNPYYARNVPSTRRRQHRVD
jgi:hypothetical protein